MPSHLTGFVCPNVSMVTTGHATGVEKTLLGWPEYSGVRCDALKVTRSRIPLHPKQIKG